MLSCFAQTVIRRKMGIVIDGIPSVFGFKTPGSEPNNAFGLGTKMANESILATGLTSVSPTMHKSTGPSDS